MLPYGIVRIFVELLMVVYSGTSDSCLVYILGTYLSGTHEIGSAMHYTRGLNAYTELGILLAANVFSLTRA